MAGEVDPAKEKKKKKRKKKAQGEGGTAEGEPVWLHRVCFFASMKDRHPSPCFSCYMLVSLI